MPTPNFIKYSTTPDDKSIKVGNYSIGVASGTTYGPTSSTSYWSGISPPTSGYTIYENKVTNGPSIRVPSDSATLIDYANRLYSGSSITTEAGALVYFNSLNTVICVNRNYEEIVTSGLTLLLDAGFTPSYPKSGTSWTDLSFSGNNGTLINGPTFNSSNGGSIVFDGTNDYVNLSDSDNWFYTGNFTIEFWYYFNSVPDSLGQFFYNQRVNGDNYFFIFAMNTKWEFDSYIGGVQGPKITYPTTHNTGTWNCISLTRIENNFSLYLNSTLVGSQTNSSNLINLNAPLEFGRWSGGPSRYINASVSSLKIYKGRGLTTTEIQQNFNAQKSRFGL